MQSKLIPKKVRPLPEPSSSSSEPPAPVDQPPAKKKRKRPPSAAHREKSRKKSLAKLGKKTRAHRKVASRERGSSQHYCYGRGGKSVGPFVSVDKDRLLTGAPDVSEETMDFYYQNWCDNQYLEVRESANVSNPTGKPGGGKGVFAKKHISAGTRVCPYVGQHRPKPCAAELGCQYDLRLEKGFFICGRETLYDIGYLMSANQERHQAFITSELPCPPNYGRFMNTASAGLTNNCQFELAGDGLDAMFITTSQVVEEGAELLVDYGEWFTIAPDDVSETGTVCGSDGDPFEDLFVTNND